MNTHNFKYALNNHAFTWVAIVMLGGMMHTVCAAKTEAGMNDAKSSGVMKRDPFWPVGYTPKEDLSGPIKQVSTTQTGGSWNEAMKQVVINGVSESSESEYYAVINGELKSVGDTVSVRMGPVVYTWAVSGIEPSGSVKLRRVSVR